MKVTVEDRQVQHILYLDNSNMFVLTSGELAVSPDLQENLCAGAGSRLSQPAVLGPRVLPQTQLREGAVEVSSVQVRRHTLMVQQHNILFCSKPALLEGLEVDQYMWSVIQSPQVTQCRCHSLTKSHCFFVRWLRLRRSVLTPGPT